MYAIHALAPGDSPTVDELNQALIEFQNIVLDIHEARGPLLDVDVTSYIIPGEDQRLRIQTGVTFTLTLPNAVACYGSPDPYDYGFNGAPTPPLGITGPADGYNYRAPRDGARIEVIGTVQALYMFRADINTWQPATGLSNDSESPFNARYSSHLSAMLAERIAPNYPELPLDRFFTKRVQSATKLMVRPGVARDPVKIQYF